MTRFLLDTEVILYNEDHADHMISINSSIVRGGVYRMQIWCANCRRHLTAFEGIATSTIEQGEIAIRNVTLD